MPKLRKKSQSQKLALDRKRKREIHEDDVDACQKLTLDRKRKREQHVDEDPAQDVDPLVTSGSSSSSVKDKQTRTTNPEHLISSQLQKEIQYQVQASKRRKLMAKQETSDQAQDNGDEKSRKRSDNKLRQQKRRAKMSNEQKSVQRKINRAQQKTSRSKKSETEISLQRNINNKQHQHRREQMNKEEKTVQREKDKKQHQHRREQMNEEEKTVQREINKKQNQHRREQMNVEEKTVQRKINKAQQKTSRSKKSETKRSLQRNINNKQHQDRRAQMNVEEKSVEREINKKQHQHRREQMNVEEKTVQREINKKQHQHRREQMNVEEKTVQREKDKKQHQHRREQMNVEEKTMQREINKNKHQDRREREKKRKSDLFSSYQESMSSSHAAVDEIVHNFLQSIQKGPTHVCCICNRMLYRSSVKMFNDNLKTKASNLSLLSDVYGQQYDWICLTCANCIIKSRIPSQSQYNKMKVQEPNETLKSLCNLEKQLISKIIPFMKIYSLPKGSQKGLKGQVVLVPSNIQNTASSLPRNTTDAQIIALNLKRRLSDNSVVCKEFIRPQLVNRAFQSLKLNNEFYMDITLNETWDKKSEAEDDQLWQSVHADTDIDEEIDLSEDNCDESSVLDDSDDEVEKDIPIEVAEDLQYKRSLNSITCLYPEHGPTVKSNKILNLAPAEGQRPTSIFYQDNWETLAFPTLFPDGKNTFHENRTVAITPKKYVNGRLLSKDFRFAESAEYTFQCLHWIESVSVNDGITFALKKTRQDDISVLSLQNSDNLQKMFKDDEIYASFKRIRGTPQYWKEMQHDMLAKIKHFGPYTFFISGSAADFYWPELIQIVAKQYGENYDLDFIENNMDKKTKRSWLARNPVTVARHIDFIFRKLWGNVILSGIHPVGQILNFDVRKEMQSRGTAHFHSAVHVQNAPILDKNTDREVIEFIDKYIKATIPLEGEDDLLRNLVVSRQTHHHQRTCTKKKGVECRFHFPKPPASRTTISRVPCSENVKLEIDKAKSIILHVMDTLKRYGTEHTLTDILEESKISEDEYNKALQISAKKTTILLERKPSETCVNPYNPVILKCLRANMDIQYITDVWACVAYITSYMCKPEKTMSDLMRNACKEATTVKDKLKSIGNVFLKSREVSQHETIARLVGLPLKESNVPVMFIPTGFKHQRTRLLKPRALLERMDDDDTDVFLPNVIDKYVARPDKLQNMCLAEFASSYSRASNNKDNNNDDDDDDDDEHEEKENLSKREKIKLKNDLGVLVRRKSPVVLRDYFVSKERDSEKFFHRLLFLYQPWRDENELLVNGSYETKYQSIQQEISETVHNYEPYIQEVTEAAEVCENLEGQDEEIWDTIAPQAEQIRDNEENVGTVNILLDHEKFIEINDDDDVQPEQIQKKSHSLSTNIHVESDSKYSAMVRSLNRKQREIHDHILSHCRHICLAGSEMEEPSPFHIFLSGGAGVGKSHTVHTIYQTVIRTLKRPGQGPDLPTILLTAPTGKAAVNIDGNTLHSAFHLPVRSRGRYSENKRLSANVLNSLKALYCQLKVLVIDEISMVGAQTLSNLNVVLQDIFENDKPFGNISVLAVGDLMQLNPVGEKPVYKESNYGYAALTTSVWRLFSLFALTDIVRQKGDPTFAELLSRVRVGQHNSQDVELLKQLENNKEVPSNALSVFLTNSQKDYYNKCQLEKLPTKVYTVIAKDSKKDLYTKRVNVEVTSTNLHETGGLAKEIQVAVMAKFMQSKNVDIQDGLVNGATGVIEKIEIHEDQPLNGILYVRFDDPKIGRSAKVRSPHKGLVPVKAVTAAFSITEKSRSVKVERTQFPGTLAYGITVHKSQGSTFEEMVGDMTIPTDKSMSTMPGQIYTMLSRAKSMKGLKLCAFDSSKIKVNTSALQEMERLQKDCQLSTDTLYKYLYCSKPVATILCLNIRSLKEHHQDIVHYITSEFSGFLCLQETKVHNHSKFVFDNMKFVSKGGRNYIHGNVIYSTVSDVEEVFFQASTIEIVTVFTANIFIASVYIRPNHKFKDTLEELKDLMEQFQAFTSLRNIGKTLVVGDFNLSFDQLEKLTATLRLFGLSQLVKEPTHQLGSILDLVFSNINDSSISNVPLWFTDHHAVAVSLQQ